MKALLAAALLCGAALAIPNQVAVAAAAPAAAAPAAAAAAPVPLETFSYFPGIQNPHISTGGHVIAAKVRYQGRQALALLPIGQDAKPEIIAQDGQFDVKGDLVIRGWTWVDDENLLITLTSHFNWNGQWIDPGRVVAYNRVTRKLTPIGWDKKDVLDASRILWMSKGGRPTVLVERVPMDNNTEMWGRPEVVKVDVLTGRDEVVQPRNAVAGGWSADAQGVVRIGSHYDSESGRFTAIYRPPGSSNFRTVIDEKEDRLKVAPLPRIFLANGKALGLSRADGFTAVYEMDPETMKLGRKVFGVPGYDVDGISSTPSGDALEAIYVTEDRDKVYFMEPRLKEIQQVLEETFGKGNVLIASADRARETIVAHVSTPGAPGAYYVFDTRTGAVGRLGWVNEGIKDAAVNPVSTIRYRSSDGKDIEAVLTMPRHRKGQKNLPLIVLPHGGPWGRDSADWEYVPWAQPLAELGYVVIQPNFRGSTGYGRDWEKAADGNWGERMQDDLNDAVTYLASQGIADPKRVCMMGWSYGGYAASRAAQRDGSKYRCAISGAGPHDLPGMVAYDKNYLGAYAAKHALGSAGKLQQVSPGLHPADYSTPILIIHGEKDQRVPVSQSRNLVQKLKAAGKVEGRDFEYLELPRETHNLLLESSRLKVLQAVKAFLDKHNPA
jgi:dipeptidyl aminopeptidase/acylaminoacyl peptidase